MTYPSLLQRLKERKLVQWAIAYPAGAWVIYEVTATVGSSWGLPDSFFQGLFVVFAIGFFITLILAWYHGEKGRQRVSGPELLMVASLLVVTGVALSMTGREPGAVQSEDQPASGEIESVVETLTGLPGIAVLPFENRSGVSDDQFFTDGIQDDLLTRLQRISPSGLRVISRTSAEVYRDSELTILEIGRELGVGYVLEGGVQRAGGTVRINVQLIEAATDVHLWAETFDRPLTTENLFDIQSEIVGSIAGELNIALRQGERRRAARRTTTDLEAYNLYLRAFEHGTWSSRGIPLLEEAIERDPEFVGAYARLAMIHADRYRRFGERSEEIAAAARTAAERALELAPESEDAQIAMGLYLYRVVKDYDAALGYLIRASGALLGDTDYHRYSGWVQRRAGRWRQALASFEAAASLSPRQGAVWNDLQGTYVQMRRYADAEAASQEYVRFGPTRPALQTLARVAWFRDGTTDGHHRYLGQNPSWEVAMLEGRYEDAMAFLPGLPDVSSDQYSREPRALLEAETLEALGQRETAREKYWEAVDTLESLIEAFPNDHRYHAALALAFAGLGMREEAIREGLRAVEIIPRERDALDGPHQLFYLAAVYARLGEVDEALEVLEDLLSAPSQYPPIVLEDHYRLRPIQDDPRFEALMDREREVVF
ncbi:MAG: hypothetical protein PVJ76_09015 [Gemmatimonadota bacterium]|jgi:TolB-like protein/Tfp pilus assembly protein PilF